MKRKTNFRLKTIIQMITGFAFLMSVFTACEEDDITNDDENPAGLNGIYINNEGSFESNNSSVTFIDPETNEVTKKVFQNANGRELGDILQDISFAEDQVFLVVNNSKKVEIADQETFQSTGVISNVDYPRQFEQVSPSHGYLTNGNSASDEPGEVYIIDLIKNQIVDSISVGRGPESLLVTDDFVFVANSGGHSQDSTVFVIDKNTHQTVDTVKVAHIPFDLDIDSNGDIWVFCKGLGNWQDGGPTNSKLVKIDYNDFSTITFDIGKTGSYGYYLLAMDKQKDNVLYAGSDGVYKMNINDSQVPDSPVIEKIPYGIDVNPSNNELFITTSNYAAKGILYRYDDTYSLIDSTEVGYNPNAIIFNE